MLGSIMELLGLDLPVPDHTTFSRRSVDLGVAAALKKARGSVTVVNDSTGLKVFGTGEWHLEKHGGTPRRTWRKLHVSRADRAHVSRADRARCRGRKFVWPTERRAEVIADWVRDRGGHRLPAGATAERDRKA